MWNGAEMTLVLLSLSSVEDVIELLTGIDQLGSKQLMERVEEIPLINDQSRGKGLTNANEQRMSI